MNELLVDQIYDHHEWIRYIRPRKICYDYNIVEKYRIDDIIVMRSKSGYKYDAKLYLSYYIFLMIYE